jgi:CBS domain-containing protein
MKSLVRDVMTTEVVTVEPWTPFREIVTRLAGQRISAAPVLDAEGNVLGVVTEADLLLKQEHPDLELNVPLAWSRRRRLEREKAAAVVAGKLMTTPPVTVAPTATITEAARQMHTAGVKRLPVVDEAGRLVGIVSRADLLKVFIRSDEAIWREIMDDVIVGDFMMDPSRFFIDVVDGVVVLQGRIERSRLIPFLVRAVHGVEGVVRVEDRLTFDIDDRDLGMPMVYPWMGPRALQQGNADIRR